MHTQVHVHVHEPSSLSYPALLHCLPDILHSDGSLNNFVCSLEEKITLSVNTNMQPHTFMHMNTYTLLPSLSCPSLLPLLLPLLTQLAPSSSRDIRVTPGRMVPASGGVAISGSEHRSGMGKSIQVHIHVHGKLINREPQLPRPRMALRPRC